MHQTCSIINFLIYYFIAMIVIMGNKNPTETMKEACLHYKCVRKTRKAQLKIFFLHALKPDVLQVNKYPGFDMHLFVQGFVLKWSSVR